MSETYIDINENGQQINPKIVPLSQKFYYHKEDFIKILTLTQQRTFSEEIQFIQELGGLQKILNGLQSDTRLGIKSDESEINERIQSYGSNMPPFIETKGFFQLFIGALDDFTLKILMVSSVVSIIVSTATAWHDVEERKIAWIEGFAILIAVAVSSLVTTVNDYQKEKQFKELNDKASARKTVNVIRDGANTIIHQSLVVTGDVLEIVEGMEIPADGIILQASEITMDESPMTGETDPVKKNEVQKCMEERDQIIAEGSKNTSSAHDVPSPIILSGTKVLTGSGKYLVLVVGDSSSIGKIRASLNAQEPECTPLQQKLEKIARDIGYFGLYSAICIVIVLCIRFGIGKIDEPWNDSDLTTIVSYFIIGVTVVVVAIPEGLPLSVTLSLAYSVKKMFNDQNLVRKMAACETMGGANIICSDKTGTLTQNKMTLTNIWNEKILQFDSYQEQIDLSSIVPQKLQELFLASLNCNSSAALRPEQRGSKTEIAFLEFTDKCGFKYEPYREKYETIQMMPFSSARKRMGLIMNFDSKKILLSKGASEMILTACTKFQRFEDDMIVPLSQDLIDTIEKNIELLAKQSLRTICIAYKEISEDEDLTQKDNKGVFDVEKSGLTLLAILGIKDMLREEVKDAIQKCYSAGISVRMVTGDNKVTARAIALDCQIIDEDLQNQIETNKINLDDVVKNGIDFMDQIGGIVCKKCQTQICDCPRDETAKKLNGGQIRIDTILNSSAFDKLQHTLKVIARCRPDDKYAMVTGLRERGHVVAVTGDGTNDAPALKKADVGFAMGIAGTEVARDAAAIILLDDNFNSIVKAVMWGRNIYDSIRKFLQFQLTINVVAVSITLVGAAVSTIQILQAIQMLWINLIMDTFASLALATEPPTEKLLDRKPHNRNDYIVSKKMFKHIVAQAILQMIIILYLVYDGQNFLPEYRDSLDDKIYNIYNSNYNNYINANISNYEEKLQAFQKIQNFYSYSNNGIFQYSIFSSDTDDIVETQYIKNYMMETYTDQFIQDYVKNNSVYQNYIIKPKTTFNDIDYKIIYSSLKYSPNTINNTYSNKIVCEGISQKQLHSNDKSINIQIGPSRHFTYVFNAFVMLQVFNFINARKIYDEYNSFEGITKSTNFLIILIIIMFFQAILVTNGGEVFYCYHWASSHFPMTNGGLNIYQWLICIGLGSIGIIMNIILKFIPDDLCFQTGNKQIDPTKDQGIMNLKRNDKAVRKSFVGINTN